jgi:hypothetical protein
VHSDVGGDASIARHAWLWMYLAAQPTKECLHG